MSYRPALWSLGILMLLAAVGSAQVASRIRGTVRDSSDAVVRGVKVTIEDLNRGGTVATETNEAGQFSDRQDVRFLRSSFILPKGSNGSIQGGQFSRSRQWRTPAASAVRSPQDC